jgi:deoxycytidine triphosphate deaminase
MVFPNEIKKFNYAKNIEDAKNLFESSKEIDPLPAIPATLLNKRDIAKYASKTGMIYPFNPEDLKAASYTVKLGREILYWDKDGNQQHKEELKENDPIVLKRNSITFVSVEPKFFVPSYIALRFNLSITHVHRGLLLGTGPLIDPTFVGRIMIPIHNLTNNDYTARPGDELIAVEFTKIWFDPEDTHDINFEKLSQNIKKPDMSFADYFKEALPHNIPSVESSLWKTVEETRQKVDQSKDYIDKIKEEADKTRYLFTGIGAFTAAALVIATIAIFFQAKSVVSDANKYVRDSSNALQGDLQVAIDADGFEKAVNLAKEEVSNRILYDFTKITEKQKKFFNRIDTRLDLLENKIEEKNNLSGKGKLELQSEIDEVRNDIKAIKSRIYDYRLEYIHKLLEKEIK